MSVENCEVERKAERDIAPALSMAEAAKLSKMFKLNVVCFEDLFDRLALKELLTLRATCKRIKQVVDYYIRINFPAVKLGWRKVSILDNFREFRNLGVNDIRMIREIEIWIYGYYRPELFVEIKDVLAQAESISIYGRQFNGDFYDVFLKFCNNFKLLYIEDIKNFIAETGREWLLRQYPTLEHFVLQDERAIGPNEVIEFKTFFELNPNIRIFSTNSRYLLGNYRWMVGSNITFDRLDVVGDRTSEGGMHRICGLLNELHEQGFYKRLNFSGNILGEEDINQIFSLNLLEKLLFGYIKIDYSVPQLTGLKELSFHTSDDIRNANAWASNLIRVERICVVGASLTGIMPFISHSKNVREIKIDWLWRDDHFNDEVVDLRSLNEMREKLAGAKKLIIYVKEEIYLKTKWTNMGTIFSLIELKRVQSMEKGFDWLFPY